MTVVIELHVMYLYYGQLYMYACVGAAEHHPANLVGELPSESGGETTGPAPGENQTSHTRGRGTVATATLGHAPPES